MKRDMSDRFDSNEEESLGMASAEPGGEERRWSSDPSVRVTFKTGDTVYEGPVLWPYW